MDKISTFSNEIRLLMDEAYNGMCCVNGCYDKIMDFHHAIHNTKNNRKKYPLFLNSVFNCRPVCREHHNNHREYVELNLNENLAQVYEDYLQNLKIENYEE